MLAKKLSYCIVFLTSLVCILIFQQQSFSQTPVPSPAVTISDIQVEGNRAIQTDAIRNLMSIKAGQILDTNVLRHDLLALLQSGFFEDVRFVLRKQNNSNILVTEVTEKPSIREIRFSGFREIKSSTVSDKMQTKVFTIVNEKKIANDLKSIEQAYIEKGYYLARASYELTPTSSSEVVLTFSIAENDPISVGSIHFMGNSYLSDNELKNGLMTREKRWTSWLTSAGVFRDEFVSRDKEFLTYLHRDNGFAEAAVANPQARLNTGRNAVEVSFYIEEGERYNIGNVTLSGDLLKSNEDIVKKLSLKKGELFRISLFEKDIRLLSDEYGNEGYAFADINPKTQLDRQNRTVDVEYAVTKGEKIYFRNIFIEGNSKTRDNVIRRAMRVNESEKFHASNLEKSKTNIERLGYFSEVQILREPDVKNHRMDLRVRVKEQSTGSLSMRVGVSPGVDGRTVHWMAEGQFAENNLLGKGWNSNFTGQATPNGSWNLATSAMEPSIYNGPWSLEGFAKYSLEITDNLNREVSNGNRHTRSYRVGFGLGRELLEDFRLSLAYSVEQVTSNYIPPTLQPYTRLGMTERLSQTLRYDKTDNFSMPTSGFSVSLRNAFAVSMLGGENIFGKAELSLAAYVPVQFSDSFKTNFRFAIEPGLLYSIGDRTPPPWERFVLGSMLDMRAYYQDADVISPKIFVMETPQGPTRQINLGGNRRLYGVAEYFFPVIQEANLRFVLFYETGSIVTQGEKVNFSDFKHDIGMGFRWKTPIAPFRFEWAWPVSKGKLGQYQPIIFVGLDSVTRFE